MEMETGLSKVEALSNDNISVVDRASRGHLRLFTNLHGHKRPLPPPESRNEVIDQCKAKRDWEAVDNSSDILIFCTSKRRKVHSDTDRISIISADMSDTSSSPFSSLSESTVQQSDINSNTTRSSCSPPVESKHVTGGNSTAGLSSYTSKDPEKYTYSAEVVKHLEDDSLQPSKDAPLLGNLIHQGRRLHDPLSHEVTTTHIFPQTSIDEHNQHLETLIKPNDATISEVAHKELVQEENDGNLVHSLAALQSRYLRTNIESKNNTPVASEALEPFKREGSFDELFTPVIPRSNEGYDFCEEKSKQLREQALARRRRSTSRLESQFITSATPDANEYNNQAEESILTTDVTGNTENYTTNIDQTAPENILREDSSAIDEKLLDIAQNSSPKFDSTGNATLVKRPESHRHKTQSNIVHPASCEAAEQFRTQSRHLDHGQQELVTDITGYNLQTGECRLRQLTYGNEKHQKFNQSKYLPYKKFENRFQEDSGPTNSSSDLSLGLRRNDSTNDTVQNSTVNRRAQVLEKSYDVESIAKEKGATASTTAALSVSSQNPTSGLGLLAVKVNQESMNSRSGKLPNKTTFSTVPHLKATHLLPKDLTLPVNFERLRPERQELVIEHERLKERIRDLQLIKPLFTVVGRLKSLVPLTESEEREVQEARRFVALVVDQSLPGKSQRKRAATIRLNFKKKTQRYDDISEDQAAYWCSLLLSRERIDKIDHELEIAEFRANELQTSRSQMTARAGSSHSKARRQPTSNERRRPISANLNREKWSYQAKLESNLELFKTFDSQKETSEQGAECSSTESDLACPTYNQDEDPTSEEEDGAQFVFGAGRSSQTSRNVNSFTASVPFPELPLYNNLDEVQDLEEINRLEDEIQRCERPTNSQAVARKDLQSLKSSTQDFHRDLFLKMQDRKAQLNAITRNEHGIEDNEDTCSDSGSSDLEMHTASSTEPKELFQYRVLAQFVGVDNYEAGIEYVFKTTYSLDKANENVRLLIQQVQHDDYSDEFRRWTLQATHHESGTLDQTLTIGINSAVQAHVWVDRQLISNRDRAYWRARRYSGSNRKSHDIFAVDWTKTITTRSIPAEAIEEEDLFGPETDSTSTTTTEHAPTSSIKYFRLVSQANRHAKDVMLAWYSNIRPSLAEEYARRILDEACEAQLRRLGEEGIWDRTETVEIEDKQGGKQILRSETMRVWIREVIVHGPWN